MIHKQGIIPEGKGIFIHYLYRLAGGDMAALADQLKADGYQWAAPKMQDGQYDFTPHNQMALMEQFAKELKRVGVLLVGWGYIYGETSAYRKLRNWSNREADKTLELIGRFQPVAWMVNAEKEHKNHSNAGKSAAKYMNLVKAGMAITNDAIKEIPIGLSSYKFPDQHNNPPKWTFPWLEFLSRSDFAAPQVYWLGATDDDAPEYQLEKSIDEYKKYGAEGLPFLVAGCVKADNTSWVTSPEQMENFNDAVFNHPDVVGCNYWTRYYLSLYPVLDSIVNEFVWGAEPEPPPVDDKDDEQDQRLETLEQAMNFAAKRILELEEDVALCNQSVALLSAKVGLLEDDQHTHGEPPPPTDGMIVTAHHDSKDWVPLSHIKTMNDAGRPIFQIYGKETKDRVFVENGTPVRVAIKMVLGNGGYHAYKILEPPKVMTGRGLGYYPEGVKLYIEEKYI